MKYSQELIDKLLQEAKDKYPPGTRFKSAYRGCEFIVGNVGEFCSWVGNSPNVIWNISVKGHHDGLLYYNGTWAEIISYPERINLHTTNSYEIY